MAGLDMDRLYAQALAALKLGGGPQESEPVEPPSEADARNGAATQVQAADE